MPLAQHVLEVHLSIQRPDDGVLKDETFCHVTDSADK
jgi:hypothetical protein